LVNVALADPLPHFRLGVQVLHSSQQRRMIGMLCVVPYNVALVFAHRFSKVCKLLSRLLHAMRIEVVRSKRILNHFPVLEVIVRPNASLSFIGHLFPKYLAQLLKVSVHAGIATDHCHDSTKAVQGAQRLSKVIRCHFPKRILVFQQACAIAACQITLVRHIHTNNVHLVGTAHSVHC
jgi:hypothetical protein